MLVSIVLSIPAVQTSLGKKATKALNEDFNVAIDIKKVDLSFLGNIQLKEVFIKNHHSDTLIYVENLTTSLLSFRNVINNKMEFGTISLDNFILNIRTYEGETDDDLTIFTEKFDDGPPSDEPSGFLLTADKLKLSKGFVNIQDDNLPDEKPVFFKNVSGKTYEFKIEGPNVSTSIEELRFVENHNIEVTNLKTLFTYTKTFMNFESLELTTQTSNVIGDLIFTYDREDFSDFNNKVKLNAAISEANLSLYDLQKFYDKLGNNDVFHLRTNLEGTLNNFLASDFNMQSDNNMFLRGDLKFVNSFNTENGFSLQGAIQKASSNYTQLKKLLPTTFKDSIPSYFTKIGNFTIEGNTLVSESLIDAKLTIDSDLGKAITDLELTNFSDTYKTAYIGHIKFVDFELGKVLNDSLIGQISLDADVEGEGFDLEKMSTSVKGQIYKHQYKNYTYNNIAINGIFKNKHFNGEMEVNDENVKLNFNGLADFSKEVYNFNFKATVDYCDLNITNLFTRDSISNLRGDIEINVNGNSVDDLIGEINFKNALYTNQKQNYFFKDFNITSTIEDNIHTVSVNSSEIISGYIQGNFKFQELGKLTQNSIGSLFSNFKPHPVTPNQYLDFRFKIYNKIVEVFYPNVTLGANTFIRGKIDSDENLFKLDIKSPKIETVSSIIDDINLQIDNKNPLFNTQLVVNKIQSNIYDINDLRLVNITLNDTLYFKSNFKGGIDKTEDFNLAFYHTFNSENKSVFGVQKSTIKFKGNTWNINPEDNFKNKVVYDSKNKFYTIDLFEMQSKDQKILLEGSINDTISKDLKFNFKNVKLSSITPEIDSLKLAGLLNGTLNYNEFQKQVKPTAHFNIDNFKINNSLQGDLMVDMEGKNSLKQYEVDISLTRNNQKSFTGNGIIDFTPTKPTIDVLVNFEAFKLDAFSPLGEDVFTNIRGYLYGETAITGLLENPDMTGDLFLDEAGMYIPYLNVDYNFKGTSVINLRNQTFDFEDVTLEDTAYKTKARLTGTITHNKFEEWLLNLNINSSNILVLNTEEEENSLYFGKGYLSGGTTIKGPTDKLVIDILGKTNKGTYFVIPISDVKTVESNQLVRFITNEKENNDEDRRQFISEKLKGLTINFNLEVTEDAIVEMVVDKSTGSFLRGSGSGNLLIEVDTKDKFDMYGDFIVDNGIYNFKYGGFINKPFIVKKGGSISWSGDPFTADINLEAVYRVSANPKQLLENISSSRKIPIDLVTKFSGELFNSKREFDILIPNSSSNVASELEFRLNNNDQNSKTIHFISLLMSGSFYNESDLSVNSNSALYGTASDMISNAFDNIFNQGDNKFKLKPVYTVGERNRVDNLTIDDQLAIALDYQVNDRILINGRVGVPVGSKEQATVIGEVNIEFLLNEDGTLRSSIFNRQNDIQYNEEEEGYTQGVGLSYKIDFDNGSELLQKIGLKKSNNQDTTLVKSRIDSTTVNKKLINFKKSKNYE